MGQKPIRFGVVGLGHFAQSAILPAFKPSSNAQLVAVFSDDREKRDAVKAEYELEHAFDYADFDRALASGILDAVYIALPNSMHCEFTLRAARAKVHVLCEKPMAVDEDECERMITACENAGVKLMIAYRLHFEQANLEAIEIAKSGKLGEVRAFSSVFAMNVRDDNIRTQHDLGGGPLADIGIYCINASRYIFQSEPTRVVATSASKAGDPRFREVPEQVSFSLEFPDARLASILCTFNGSSAGYYDVIGTEGTLRVDPAFTHSDGLAHELRIDGKTTRKSFGKRDQVAPEIMYFADCIAQNKVPEPSGYEGLADVRIIRAIETSVRTGRAVELDPVARHQRPGLQQAIKVKAHGEPELVKVEPPQADK